MFIKQCALVLSSREPALLTECFSFKTNGLFLCEKVVKRGQLEALTNVSIATKRSFRKLLAVF